MIWKCIQHIIKGSVVVERFIRTLKNKIYNYATSVSNKLVEILNKQYNQNDPC